ncbi:MAG: hypothetical protein J7L76_05550 [Spirochaetaceae bacterium]|nr:hypothetical protein [Spirochaetaceae bacterium]RKX77545.1 MAG: hypothetical protein DRP60_06360 [Spirochaetota bacterium]RKX78014.1 MAG: hypothetical protein DRP49_01335 [Spirochaetota bacterium]RKX96556.1 MAG: hypothetical protein DRZ90_08685 [Spirochaetota bacterium]
MPLKLIGFIITLLIIITFIGVNLDNNSDITIWFGEKGRLTDVPIFVSFFVMYLIGVLSVVPFLLSWKLKKRSSEKKVQTDSEPAADKEKKSVRVLGSRKKRKKESDEDSKDAVDETAEESEEVDPS